MSARERELIQRGMRGAKELFLEDYVRFFSREELPLSMDQLCKIARINGFIKQRNINKSSLLDVLRTVDLTPPGRSTAGECLVRSSTNAELTLDEVVKDITSLGWQECPIVSILTVGNERAMEATEETAPLSSSCSSFQKKKDSTGGEFKGSGAKHKRKTVEAMPMLQLTWPVDRVTGSPSSSQV